MQLQEDDFVDEFREENEKVAANDEEEEREERVNETKKSDVDNVSEDGEEVKKQVVSEASPEVVEAAMIAAVKKIVPGKKNTVDLREVLNRTKKEEGYVMI